jgi:hypothetical protein
MAALVRKTIAELAFGPNDAQDYRSGTDEELLHRLFLVDENLETLCKGNSIYFLIGEKGTGKTAYATYVSRFGASGANGYDLFISPNDYSNFLDFAVTLDIKQQDYHLLWESIFLLMLVYTFARDKRRSAPAPVNVMRLADSIDDFAIFDRRPTVSNIFNLFSTLGDFVEAARTILENNRKSPGQPNGRRLLSYLRSMIAESLSAIANETPFIMFIDGIDVRPSDLPTQLTQDSFLRSVRGIVTAVWNLNKFVLSDIRSIRVVLLIRPDIIDQSGLQNLNAKVRDNAIVFNWFTRYIEYRQSRLFKLADGILSRQQAAESWPFGQCWDSYFNYRELQRDRFSDSGMREEDSFIPFLRSSFYRPRDIVTMLRLMQRHLIDQGKGNTTSFEKGLMYANLVRREYSDYLFNEVRDGLGFYYTDEVTALFKQFFDFLSTSGFDPQDREFRYSLFEEAFKKLTDYVERNRLDLPEVFATPDKFLQALYELNVIGYREKGVRGTSVLAWSFRQRSVANVRPAVKTHTTYVLHYGIARALYPERVA